MVVLSAVLLSHQYSQLDLWNSYYINPILIPLKSYSVLVLIHPPQLPVVYKADQFPLSCPASPWEHSQQPPSQSHSVEGTTLFI